MVMVPNCLDSLTIIPKIEITTHGIPYLKKVIQSMPDFKEKDQRKWNVFWVYFEKFWCSDANFIETWNTHDADLNGHPDLTIVLTMDWKGKNF